MHPYIHKTDSSMSPKLSLSMCPTHTFIRQSVFALVCWCARCARCGTGALIFSFQSHLLVCMPTTIHTTIDFIFCGPASCGKVEHAPWTWGPSWHGQQWQPDPAQADRFACTALSSIKARVRYRAFSKTWHKPLIIPFRERPDQGCCPNLVQETFDSRIVGELKATFETGEQ